jgi:hypothetical protein
MMIEATNLRCFYMRVSVKNIPMIKGQLTQQLGGLMNFVLEWDVLFENWT